MSSICIFHFSFCNLQFPLRPRHLPFPHIPFFPYFHPHFSVLPSFPPPSPGDPNGDGASRLFVALIACPTQDLLYGTSRGEATSPSCEQGYNSANSFFGRHQI